MPHVAPDKVGREKKTAPSLPAALFYLYYEALNIPSVI